jgi:predicted DNA-binding protein YlxM (UPF0122 family)
MDTARYHDLLQQTQSLLEMCGVKDWSNELKQWLSELEAIEIQGPQAIHDHLKRTKNAFGGMGSLSDIFLYEQNAKAKAQLDRLRDALYDETKALLTAFGVRP